MILIRGRGKYAKWCFLISAISLLLVFVGDFLILHKAEVDLVSLSLDEIETDMHIKAVIDASYGYFATESETNRSGKVIDEDQYRYYLVPVSGSNDEDLKLMAVKVYRSSYPIFEKITNETLSTTFGEKSYAGGSSVIFGDAKTVSLSSELRGYYREWFRDTGIVANPDDYLLPYCMVVMNRKEINLYMGISALLVAGGVLWVLIAFSQRGKFVVSNDTYEPPVYQPKYSDSSYGSPYSHYEKDSNNDFGGGWGNNDGYQQTGGYQQNGYQQDGYQQTGGYQQDGYQQTGGYQQNGYQQAGYTQNAYSASSVGSTGSDRVDFMGSVVFRTDIDNVNDLVRAGRRREAADELALLTGMTGPQADTVLQNWSELYRSLR